MRWRARGLLAGAWLWAVAGAAAAQAPCPAPHAAAPAPGEEIAGVVARVEPAKGTLRVAAKGGAEREVRVTPATEISVDGRRASLEAIHPGAEVRASLREGAGDPVAIRVEVGPGLAAAGPDADPDAPPAPEPDADAARAAPDR